MSRNGFMKRKSCDALDFNVQTQPKKDRAWYDQESEKSKDRGGKDKKRLSFIGNIGNMFSKMKSSSKLSASTSSLHKNVSRTSSNDENSFASTSEQSTISGDSLPYKKNAHLRNVLGMQATSGGDISIGDGSEVDSIGSAGSLNTPVRGDFMNRDSELRHSSRSMPAATPTHEGTVRRTHSTVASVNDSPSIWLRRKSLRLRKRMMVEQEMEELKEEEEMEQPQLDTTQTSSTPSTASYRHLPTTTPKSAFPPSSKIDRSRSAAAYSTRTKTLQQRDESSPVCYSEVGTPDTVGTMPKGLAPSSGSTSTLHKFGSSIGAALKRGFSSGSRSQRTPRTGSQTTDALVTVMRRPTMDKKRGRGHNDTMNGRRMSDTSVYGDASMHLSSRTFDDSRRFTDPDMTSVAADFSSKVTVPEDVDGLLDREEFDAIVVDIAHDGSPVSELSRRLVDRINCSSELRMERKKFPMKNSGFVKMSSSPHYVIFVVESDSDRARQLRVGYEAALQVAFNTPDIKRLLVPQLFCSSIELLSEGDEYGDSIVRSTYMSFVRGENNTKIDSISIVGSDNECAAHLKECLEKLISEKTNGLMQGNLTGSSFRR